MKKLDNLGKFIVAIHCEDCASANFSRAEARNEWYKVTETHFSISDKILAKMRKLNDEFEGKRF